jgi:carbon monoxide dehydrogenase subunit G
MKVTGSATLHASRDKVWAALNDPAVLVRTIPGCQRLEAIGEDAYRMTLTAGVASIKGVYTGEVRLTEQHPLDTFVLKAAGAGGPGTVGADVLVTLAESGDTTTLTYDADAIVGGMIGGVGQRMLTGVAKKTAVEFFNAVDDLLTGKSPAATPAAPGAAVADPTAVSAAMPGATAGVYEDSAPGALSGRSCGFVQGALVGAAAALFGAVVGGWLSGRRRQS